MVADSLARPPGTAPEIVPNSCAGRRSRRRTGVGREKVPPGRHGAVTARLSDGFPSAAGTSGASARQGAAAGPLWYCGWAKERRFVLSGQHHEHAGTGTGSRGDHCSCSAPRISSWASSGDCSSPQPEQHRRFLVRTRAIGSCPASTGYLAATGGAFTTVLGVGLRVRIRRTGAKERGPIGPRRRRPIALSQGMGYWASGGYFFVFAEQGVTACRVCPWLGKRVSVVR